MTVKSMWHQCYAIINNNTPSLVAQSVTYLTADTCLAADSWVGSSILVRSHTFVEIDHEIISTAILLPFPDSRRVVVSNKRKYVYKVLVNSLVELALEKNCYGTDRPHMTIAVDWDVKHQNKECINTHAFEKFKIS